jgi:hypothetical protein
MKSEMDGKGSSQGTLFLTQAWGGLRETERTGLAVRGQKPGAGGGGAEVPKLPLLGIGTDAFSVSHLRLLWPPARPEGN